MANHKFSQGSGNPANLILEWMGLKGSGSVTEVHDALNWLRQDIDSVRYSKTLDYTHAISWVKDLSALGFCQFDDDSHTWDMLLPRLIRLPDTGGMTVFSGYRTHDYKWILAECNMLVHDQFPVQVSNGFPMPDTVLLQAKNVETIYHAAKKLNADYLGAYALGLADELTVPQLEELDSPLVLLGKQSLAFFAEGQWVPMPAPIGAEVNHHEGFYRVRDTSNEDFYFHYSGQWICCDFDTGTVLEAKRLGRKVFYKDSVDARPVRARKVMVDEHVNLPFPQRSVLIHCSGRLPDRDEETGREVFYNVPNSVFFKVRDTLPVVLGPVTKVGAEGCGGNTQ